MLAGGAAADCFLYLSASDGTASAAGHDTNSYFNHAPGDRIDLSALDTKLSTLGTNDAFAFRAQAQGFSGGGTEVTYVTVVGGIKIMADNAGDGVADFCAPYGAGLPGLARL